MTKQITLEQALSLVRFEYDEKKGWRVNEVNGDIYGDIYGGVNGGVGGAVKGHIWGGVGGDIYGGVVGNVYGTINGRKWMYVETPKEKLQRLITESGNQELIDTFNQLENN
jgi:hypothetical protein